MLYLNSMFSFSLCFAFVLLSTLWLFCVDTFVFYRFCSSCACLLSQIINSIKGVFAHRFRLLRMEAMPMTMLAIDRTLAAFFRANSLIWSLVAWSLRRSLLAYWKKSESKQQQQLAVLVESTIPHLDRMRTPADLLNGNSLLILSESESNLREG